VEGSDHCPTWAVFDVPASQLPSRRVTAQPSSSSRSPYHPHSANALPEFQKRQQRISGFFASSKRQAKGGAADEGGEGEGGDMGYRRTPTPTSDYDADDALMTFGAVGGGSGSGAGSGAGAGAGAASASSAVGSKRTAPLQASSTMLSKKRKPAASSPQHQLVLWQRRRQRQRKRQRRCWGDARRLDGRRQQ
jgi:hypothetical protein